MLKSGNTAESVITASILRGSNEAIRNVYQNVASKYEVRLGRVYTALWPYTHTPMHTHTRTHVRGLSSRTTHELCPCHCMCHACLKTP